MSEVIGDEKRFADIKGIRQRCYLSPIIFNIFVEYA